MPASFIELFQALQECAGPNDEVEYGPAALESIDPEVLGRLSSELIALYSTAAPMKFQIEWSVEYCFLYSPSDLSRGQEGYAWTLKNGSRIPLPGWNPHWLVIGDIASDPIMADVGQINTPIFMAVHGVGHWAWRQIAESPFDLIRLLGVSTSLRNRKYHGLIESEGDSDRLCKPEFYQDLVGELSLFLKEEQIANLIEFIG